MSSLRARFLLLAFAWCAALCLPFVTASAQQQPGPSLVPDITSPLTAFANVGESFTYQITAKNSVYPLQIGVDPTTGLPVYTYKYATFAAGVGDPGNTGGIFQVSGLIFNYAGGTITGVPTKAGVYYITISCITPYGVGSNILVLTVGAAGPVIDGTAYSPFTVHNIPVNNVFYDQAFMTGAQCTVHALGNHVTQVTWTDKNDAILFAEISGPGYLTISLQQFEYQQVPLAYDLPINYVGGLASVTLSGANQNTRVAIYSLGSTSIYAYYGQKAPNSTRTSIINFGTTPPEDETAFPPIVFDPTQTVIPANSIVYDPLTQGQATIANFTIINTSLVGILDFRNVLFVGATGTGYTGIAAPGVNVTNYVVIGDITASGSSTPAFIFGNGTGTTNTATFGGDLLQTNGAPILIKNTVNVYPYPATTTTGVQLPAVPVQAVFQKY